MRTILSILVLGLLALVALPAHASPGDPPGRGEQAWRRELARRRELQLERLHAYRLAAAFTTDEQGRPASVFRDYLGRLCPMASLIDSSGHGELVDRVVRENNRLRLADVTDGPLWDWMVTSGLTREEIIRIQGVMELNFQIGPEPGAPTIVAQGLTRGAARTPSVAQLNRQVVRRLDEVERELREATEISLEVAVSRLPQARRRLATN